MKPPPAKPSDKELMLAYGAGDEEAFTLLFQRYKLRLFNYFLRHLGDRTAAEDLLQTTFLKIHRIRKSYQPSAAFSTWIFTIATNLLRDYATAARRRAQVIELGEVRREIATGSSVSESNAIAETKSPEDEYGEREMVNHIRQAVESLPAEQKEVILLAKYEGFKYEEIAEILNITVSAAKVRAHRAMKSLQKILEARLDRSSL